MKFYESIKIKIDSENYKIIAEEAAKNSQSISHIVENMLIEFISEKKEKHVRELYSKTT